MRHMADKQLNAGENISKPKMLRDVPKVLGRTYLEEGQKKHRARLS